MIKYLLAMFMYIQEIEYPTSVKVSKHNKGKARYRDNGISRG